MFWELIATITAGLGSAGIILLLRTVLKKLPKTLVPAAAGLGMLLFQIVNEYQWFANTRERLPEGTHVIASFTHSAWYKPWSYVFPPVNRFVAVDAAQNHARQDNPRLRQSQLYFFERRVPAQPWPILVDCDSGKQANLPAQGHAPDWQNASHSGELVKILCNSI